MPIEFYLVAFFAVLLAGVSKAGFGGGLGVMSVPLMALVIDPIQAAAIMLPLLMVMDALSLWHFKSHVDKSLLKILLPSAAIGIAIGAFTFSMTNTLLVKAVIGMIAVSFALVFFKGQSTEKKQTPHSANLGLFWGVISGYTSFVAHAGGPPMNAFLLSRGLNKAAFAGTTVVFFTAVNIIKVFPYAALGQFSSTNLMQALYLAPIAIVGVTIGARMHKRLTGNAFFKICYGLLLFTGCKLIFDVFWEII